jgi:nucleoside-diphosphate-sugar epimerase
MKVLVTGHDGYLGAVMTPLLAAAGRASVRLAETAKRAHVPRFLYSSSCGSYGAAEGGDIVVNNLVAYAYAAGEVRMAGELDADLRRRAR